jgi:hypothetical protein
VSIAHPVKANGWVTLADSVGVSIVVTDEFATTVTVTDMMFQELGICSTTRPIQAIESHVFLSLITGLNRHGLGFVTPTDRSDTPGSREKE